MPEVSVIIVTYNQLGTLRRAVESVLAQQCSFPFEVVIADDASTDGTADEARRIAAEHPDQVRLLLAESNQGVVTNYFNAFRQCQGKYIADCAGDDYWVGTDTLQKRYDAISARPDVNIVHMAWLTDSSTHQPIHSSTHQLVLSLLCHRQPQPLHLSTALYRKEVIDSMLARRPEMVENPRFGCEDLPVMVALLASGKCLYIPEVSLMYTCGDDTITHDRSADRTARFALDTIDCSYTLADYYGIPRRLLRRDMLRQMNYAMSIARHASDPSLMKRARTMARHYGLHHRLWRYWL